jgi:sugar O-acyltransferase (sialic acid O-acetyltransferase NeuD family)
MLIIGAGGFAKELLGIFEQKKQLSNLAFYDDLNEEVLKVFDRFTVLKNEKQVRDYFTNFGNEFTVGIGNPFLRYKLYKKFVDLGGKLTSSISTFSKIGQFNVKLGDGVNILDNVIISNNVSIGKGCIIYYQAVITHDCVIKDFVQISPAVNLLGRCKIESYTEIGANATILPDTVIGKNVIVGAGAVVTKNVKDNCIVAGVPAKIIGINENS